MSRSIRLTSCLRCNKHILCLYTRIWHRTTHNPLNCISFCFRLAIIKFFGFSDKIWPCGNKLFFLNSQKKSIWTVAEVTHLQDMCSLLGKGSEVHLVQGGQKPKCLGTALKCCVVAKQCSATSPFGPRKTDFVCRKSGSYPSERLIFPFSEGVFWPFGRADSGVRLQQSGGEILVAPREETRGSERKWLGKRNRTGCGTDVNKEINTTKNCTESRKIGKYLKLGANSSSN